MERSDGDGKSDRPNRRVETSSRAGRSVFAPADRAPGGQVDGPPSTPATVEIGLTAAVLSVVDNEPMVLVVRDGAGLDATDGLPSGPFTPLEHRTLEIGLRSWVERQARLELGYVEQLYTFGDRGRHAKPGDIGTHIVSIGYLALTGVYDRQARGGATGDMAFHAPSNTWHSWYDYFPWEDRRRGSPGAEIVATEIVPRLLQWADAKPEAGAPERPISRRDRISMCFATETVSAWDEEKVLERYELLYEAGLLGEAQRDGRALFEGAPFAPTRRGQHHPTGRPMRFDHRRILATAIGRIRGKIKYRPVIFELLPDEFTLFELQRTVEAILGPHLHKQNFRRLVESEGLVEPTGDVETATGGRPARRYRFRREVLLERPAPGLRVNPGRG